MSGLTGAELKAAQGESAEESASEGELARVEFSNALCSLCGTIDELAERRLKVEGHHEDGSSVMEDSSKPGGSSHDASFAGKRSANRRHATAAPACAAASPSRPSRPPGWS